MGRLIDIARKSRIMDISIDYNGEKIEFNLSQELAVNEMVINKEIKHQPTHYGFLSMLHKGLIKNKDTYEKQYKKAWAKAYLSKKQKIDSTTGRAYSNDVAKEYANSSKRYLSLLTKYNKAKHDMGTIGSCVESFEQRSSLIQTLSANKRKET